MRATPGKIGAPPVFAAMPPRTPREISADATSAGRVQVTGAHSATSSGSKRAEGETEGRRQRGLQRPGAGDGGNAQLVARVRLQRIMRHQFFRHLPGQRRIQPAMHVD